MSTISIIGSGGMAAAIGGLAANAGHTVEVMSRDAAKARDPWHHFSHRITHKEQ